MSFPWSCQGDFSVERLRQCLDSELLMGSLLIATGIFIYTWISGIHFSFLKRQGTVSQSPPDLVLKAVIWPLLHVTSGFDPTARDLAE